MKPDPRKNRKHMQVTLDYGNERHFKAIPDLSRLYKAREFSRWVVDMWRLWDSLVNGKTDVLIELFPAFATRLASVEGDAMWQKVYDEIIELRSEVKSGAYTSASPAAGIKALNVPKLAMPVIDDEDTVVITKGDTSGIDGVGNFLNAAFTLNSKPH